MAEFIEQNCTITLAGKSFSAGGASVVGNRIVAYLGKSDLENWHGGQIGSYRIVSSWKTPNSWVSSSMHQVVARLDGVYYTGRSAGVGMAFTGRRKAKQAWR